MKASIIAVVVVLVLIVGYIALRGPAAPIATVSASPTVSATLLPSASSTPSATATGTVKPSATATASPRVTTTASPTPWPTTTIMPTATPTPTVSPTASATPSVTPTSTPTPTVSGVQTYNISIFNGTFSPSPVTVHQGDIVIFTNNDPISYDVVATGNAFKSGSSGTLRPGDSYTLDTTALAPATYQYKSAAHPTAQGTLTIQ